MTITADDCGIAQVIFSSGERTLCVETTAPYSCDYRPSSADVGRDTLVAIAVDTAGQAASAVRVVNVPRFKATGLTAKTTPKRDRRAPFTFTTKADWRCRPAWSRPPRRLNPKRLSVVVVHGGNEVVEGIRAKRHTVRPR